MLLKRGIEIGSVNMIKLVAIWKVANGKILVLLIPKFIVYLIAYFWPFFKVFIYL